MAACGRAILTAVSLACLPSATLAGNDDRNACLTLSFAPLEQNLPACDRLIGNPRLAEKELMEALMARAAATAWAMTYHQGHEVDPRHMLLSQLADLDRAVGIARQRYLSHGLPDSLHRALSERASVAAQLGQHERALGDYAEAIALAEPPWRDDLFGRSLVYERLGRLDQAIADMSAIVARGKAEPNHASALARRGELYEAAHRFDPAIADYRAALAEHPGHTVATKALKRLAPTR